MTTIRSADLRDLAWLLEQLRAFDRFFGGKRSLFPSKDEDAMAIVAHLIDTQPFFVATDTTSALPHDDRRTGFIAGALGAHPYNPELTVLSELFWWVDPARRGSSAGARLFEHFIAYGRQHADWVVMTLEAQSPVDDRVLLKRGFVPHERSFLLEV